jgi:hypothetical protein
MKVHELLARLREYDQSTDVSFASLELGCVAIERVELFAMGVDSQGQVVPTRRDEHESLRDVRHRVVLFASRSHLTGISDAASSAVDAEAP